LLLLIASNEHPMHSHDLTPRLIKRALVVTTGLMVIEFLGGWFSGSLALMSDASHLLTDTAALLLSLCAFWIARKPMNPQMSFGYYRAEILGALLNGILIWMVVGVLIVQALFRIESAPEVHAPLTIATACLGLLANGYNGYHLHQAQHHNINLRAAYIHVIADSIGSLGAMISGTVVWFTKWNLIDPFITLFFAGLMLLSSWSLLKESVAILMESTPKQINPQEVTSDLQSLAQVQEIHDLHIWSLSLGRFALSVHIVTESSPQETLSRATELLRTKYQINHTTIQIEKTATSVWNCTKS
jgi:cobalt-zinc-cadmium efflux system protein